MRSDPAPATRTERHQTMDRWQIEATSGGRIWYLLDVERHTAWIDLASTGHPKATDR
ncbi:hypothetical protein [Streptomyces beihaiensis]|nr:hypothetical protein [Streptomyces beihaiensis]